MLIDTDDLVAGWMPRDQDFTIFDPGCCGSFKGLLDEMRLFDRPLTPAEVALMP